MARRMWGAYPDDEQKNEMELDNYRPDLQLPLQVFFGGCTVIAITAVSMLLTFPAYDEPFEVVAPKETVVASAYVQDTTAEPVETQDEQADAEAIRQAEIRARELARLETAKKAAEQTRKAAEEIKARTAKLTTPVKTQEQPVVEETAVGTEQEVIPEVTEEEMPATAPEQPLEGPILSKREYPHVTFDSSVSEASREVFWEKFCMEPAQVVQMLANWPVPIQLAADRRYSQDCMGQVYDGIFEYDGYQMHRIGISTAKGVLINHEIGHAVDHWIGIQMGIPFTDRSYPYPEYSCYSSDTQEFAEIFLAEKDLSGYHSYFKQDTAEFFAETYSRIIEGDTATMAKIPRTVEYIRRVVAESLGVTI